jgi:hypothetical protein
MLRNLFVLRGRWQIASAIIGSVIAGMSVALAFNIILSNAHARFEIEKFFTIPEIWQYVLALALGLPISLTVVVLSREQSTDKISNLDRWIGTGTGVTISILLLWVIDRARAWLFSQEYLKQVLIKLLTFLGKSRIAGYVDFSNPSGPELTRGHLTALAFFLVVLAVYLFVAYYYKPKPKSGRSEAPALLYVTFLITAANLFLSGLTFFFDVYRVLPLLLILIGSIASYSLYRVDHFFKLYPCASPDADTTPGADFKTALQNRLQSQTGKKTLVIICASGGGIQAAGWTARVLTGLQEELGDDFARAIGLISSVSGGSVGALYYLDRIDRKTGIPILSPRDLATAARNNGQADDIFNSATRDSLDAIGWGLAYPDLWRVIGLPFLAPALCDRGIAIETDWQGEMREPEHPTYISTWRERVLEGTLPIPAFNATIVDTGERFLFSPMSFYDFITQAGSGRNYQLQDYNHLYGQYDASVVTGARLSATFPYISPVCCPIVVRNDQILGFPEKYNFHFADGGYFDNSGAFTAVEWLDHLLGSESNPGIDRVMIVRINAFPRDIDPATGKRLSGRGWLMGIAGPLLALFKVRDSTQISRNDEELDILCQRWREDRDNPVDIQQFSLFFPTLEEIQTWERETNGTRGDDASRLFKDGKYDPPLSWKLTDDQKKIIKKGWCVVRENDPELKGMRKVWRHWKNSLVTGPEI